MAVRKRGLGMTILDHNAHTGTVRGRKGSWWSREGVEILGLVMSRVYGGVILFSYGVSFGG